MAVVMQRGVLKTQTSTLALLMDATIVETADSYVSGRLVTSGALAVNSSQDFGGVGLTVS